MVVRGTAADAPFPISPPPEEEQAALPHRRHHQLPGALCLAGGPPGGLCPLHAPTVSDLTHCCAPARAQAHGGHPTALGLGTDPAPVFCHVLPHSHRSPVWRDRAYLRLIFLLLLFKSSGLWRQRVLLGAFHLLALVLPTSPGACPQQLTLGVPTKTNSPVPQPSTTL